MADLVLFGTGDIARLAHRYFTQDSPHRVVAFTVDAAYRSADTFCELPLVDFARVSELYPASSHQMFIALSYAQMNTLRSAKYFEAKQFGYQLATYLSSRCTWLTDTPPGDNCFILEDNTVQPFTRIGCNVTLWSGNHIGHDSTVDDHTFISSHVVVSGHVHIGAYCFLGVNATLRNSITVAPRTLIGAGAIVMESTQEGSVYVPQRTKPFHKTSDQVKL
jgi:sugar O-acyltransferase (sialic acid O-acetyltransferase NeuD family)